VAVEQFGLQVRQIETNLSKNPFRFARIALQEQGLFRFEPITQLTKSGRSRITSWKVENLHGYYFKEYWENPDTSNQNLTPESQK
jgi:hypothetical protein